MTMRSLYFSATLAMVAFSAPLPLAAAPVESASATIVGTQLSSGDSSYSLTLNNTGTTTLGTFWFSWVPGDNFMPVSPTNITSPTGWMDTVTPGGPSNGFGIEWTAITPSDYLAAGQSLSGFSFQSSLTLADLMSPAAGNPADSVLTSFVYSGAPFSDNGVQFAPTVPLAATAPEPGELGLLMVGAFALIAAFKRRSAVK